MSDGFMTPKMKFIVDQLASLTIRQQETERIVTEIESVSLVRHERMGQKMEMMRRGQLNAVDRLVQIDAKFQVLIDAQIKADQRAAETNARWDRLAAAVEQMVTKRESD